MDKQEQTQPSPDTAARPATAHAAVQPRWEHFEHKADIGVRGIGPSIESAFEQAALALVAVCTDPARVRPVVQVELQCAAPTPELLLVEWLNALIFEMATRKMLFSRFSVQIDDQKLRATVWGEPIDVARHEPAVEVKGATYAELVVQRAADGAWVAQCVVDV